MPVTNKKSKEGAIKSTLDVADFHLMRGEDVAIQIREDYLNLFIEDVVMFSLCFDPSPELPRAGQVCRVWDNIGRLYQSKAMYRQATGDTHEGNPLFFNHWGDNPKDYPISNDLDDYLWDNWELVKQFD